MVSLQRILRLLNPFGSLRTDARAFMAATVACLMLAATVHASAEAPCVEDVPASAAAFAHWTTDQHETDSASKPIAGHGCAHHCAGHVQCALPDQAAVTAPFATLATRIPGNTPVLTGLSLLSHERPPRV